MADPIKDETTLEQSNSEEAEDQPLEQVEDNDTTDTVDDADKQTRGERRQERYIDKLSAEIRNSNNSPSEDLFPTKTYQPLDLKEGEEYDPEQLKADRDAFGTNKFAQGANLGYQEAATRSTLETFETRLDVDSERVAQKWDVLDPTKTDVYRPKLEEYLVKQYIAFTGVTKDERTGRIFIQKPNIRFRDFVDAEMQNMEDYAEARVAKSTDNVVSQAAKTGLRPNGQARQPKADHGFDSSTPEAAIQSLNRMTSEQYYKQGGKEASDAYFEENRIGMRK